MTHLYKDQLLSNLGLALKGTAISYVKYYHISTIKLILPDEMDLQEFKDGFYKLLERLPEIDHPKEMVYFWLSKANTADFRKVLINPTPEAERSWNMVGIGPESWVHSSELDDYQKKLGLK